MSKTPAETHRDAPDRNAPLEAIAGFRLLLISALCCFPLSALAVRPSTDRPNVIFILSDDVGIGNVHAYGGTYNTPNIDSLAATGTSFQYCYSLPLCSPSRCESLTGRYPFRTGLNSNSCAWAINPDREVMIPTVLKTAGYASASIGKWEPWNGAQPGLNPLAWGFDEQLCFPKSGAYWRSQITTYDVNGIPTDLPDGVYLPDAMHDFAVDFIRRHQDQPFFLNYPMVHIHSPILPTPDSLPGADAATLYADNIQYMDKLVGKLIAELDNLGLRQNTILVFTGDNGTAASFPSTVNGQAVVGVKGSMLEGGSRVPLVVNWPGTTPEATVNNDLIDFSDFFSTFAELGGAPLPAGVTLDSHSFAPQILGQVGTPRDWVYVELTGRSYARGARYKLTNGGALFDMINAPFEELTVPVDTTDPDAIAARIALQTVLDEHPAIRAGGNHSDFNGDGSPDILVQDPATGTRFIRFMNGTDRIGGTSFGKGLAGSDIAGTGDFNGDGKPDIVWQDPLTGRRMIRLMNGATTIGAVGLGTISPDWQIAAVGDFNADGKLDLVLENRATGQRNVWFLNGTTRIGTATIDAIATDWQIAGAGDFNGDGKPDLVLQNTTTGERVIRLMDGTTTINSISLGVVTTDWRIVTVDDFNVDGKPDLLWQNTVTGVANYWYMDGTAVAANKALPKGLLRSWLLSK